MKDEIAERLAHSHYRIDPSISLIRRLLGTTDVESDVEEPIKLLEVTDETTAEGIIPVYFEARPESGLIYPSLMIQITPGEYQDILRNPSTLPHDWQLGEVIEREATAK